MRPSPERPPTSLLFGMRLPVMPLADMSLIGPSVVSQPAPLSRLSIQPLVMSSMSSFMSSSLSSRSPIMSCSSSGNSLIGTSVSSVGSSMLQSWLSFVSISHFSMFVSMLSASSSPACSWGTASSTVFCSPASMAFCTSV